MSEHASEHGYEIELRPFDGLATDYPYEIERQLLDDYRRAIDAEVAPFVVALLDATCGSPTVEQVQMAMETVEVAAASTLGRHV